MDTSDFSERRSSRRIKLRESVQYRLKEAGDSQGCLSNDISEKGIRINSNDFLPLNTELNLQVQMGLEGSLECQGRVVWMEKLPFAERYWVGLEFVPSPSLANTNTIRRLNRTTETGIR